MAPFTAHSWTAATRKPRALFRHPGASCCGQPAAVPGVAAPATAPENPVRGSAPENPVPGTGWARWMSGRRRGVIFVIIPIDRHPFPHVTDHVMQTPRVRREAADRGCVNESIVALDAVKVRELLLQARAFLATLAILARSSGSLLMTNKAFDPARPAYSHSASPGRRYVRLLFFSVVLSHSQKATASL